MMGDLKNHRDERVSVSVEELVLQEYFLRAIKATINFDFIEEKLRPYYCENNGRPSIHPIVGFWGFLYQIRFQIILQSVGIAYLENEIKKYRKVNLNMKKK
ncbi:hypothetical protein ABH947_005196 [Bacillus sp. RC206]